MGGIRKPRLIPTEANKQGKIRQKDLSSGLNTISHPRKSLRIDSPERKGAEGDDEDWDELNRWDIDESFAAPIPTALKGAKKRHVKSSSPKEEKKSKTDKKKLDSDKKEVKESKS